MNSSGINRVITEPVKVIKCTQCGTTIDLKGLAPFTPFHCPGCRAEKTVPARFGNMVLLEEIGSGGMGAVYRGIDPELDRVVAVKVLLEMTEGDQQKIEAFRREAKAAARLNHPNVAHIYSFGVENGQPYIVMEYLKGRSLMGMIDEQEALGEAAALKVILEAASGLSAASEEGLVHADVKPHNILFDKAGRAKLIDFGLALFAGDDAAEQGIWGSPHYIPPERIRREKIDLRSDIYSLGATLYYALAGRPPYDGDDLKSVCKAKLNQDVKPPSEYRRGLLPETDQLVCRMLRRDPRDRYPNYASLISDIRKALQLASARPVSAVAAPQRPGAIDKIVKRIDGLTSRILGKDVVDAKQEEKRDLSRTAAHSGSASSQDKTARQQPVSRPAWIVPAVVGGVIAVAMLAIWLLSGRGPEQTGRRPPPVVSTVRPGAELDKPIPTPMPSHTPVRGLPGTQPGSEPSATTRRPDSGRVNAESALNARDDRYVGTPGASIVCDVLQNDEWTGTNFASLASVASPSNGTAVLKNGRVLYTGRAGFMGTDTFAYTVRYPSGRSSTATVAVAVGVEAVAASPTVTASGEMMMNGGSGGETTDDRLGTVTARGDKAPFEVKDMAFDNAWDTKWLDFAAASWIQYAYAVGISGKLTAYTITSANDAPERDPATWQLLGSNDGGATWTVVDNRSNIVFSARFQKQTFALSETPTYKAYRLNILNVANPAVGGCQLAEIELLGEQVSGGGTNRAPVAQDQAVTLVRDTVTELALEATDPGGGALTYSIVTAPQHGSLAGRAPSMMYKPFTNYVGSDRFAFQATDGKTTSNVATVSITIVSLAVGAGGTAATSGGGGPGVAATGGTVTNYTENGTKYTAHIFTNNGTFTVTGGGAVEYLIVGGGGAGGLWGGGGGGGGVVTGVVSVDVGDVPIVVGGGGVAGSPAPDGGSSSWGRLVAGGGGGGGAADSNGRPGSSGSTVGGSGGGGGRATGAGSGGARGKTNGNGATTFNTSGGGAGGTDWGSGGGGGGAGEPGYQGGRDNVPLTGNYSRGGAGLCSTLSGPRQRYGGGGGGTWQMDGTPEGGAGGGGAEECHGSPGTGGGGGGGTTGGGAGGSGIVIVRYVRGGGGQATAVRPNTRNREPSP